MSTTQVLTRLPRLDWREVREAERVVRYMRGVRPRLELLDATAIAGVPTIFGLVSDPEHEPATHLAIGASSGLTYAAAIDGAFREAFQTAWMSLQVKRHPQMYASLAESEFNTHILHHADLASAHESAFLLEGGQTASLRRELEINATAPRGQLEALVARTESRGQPAIAFDLTTTDVRDLGLHVFRTFQPDACWLDVDVAQPFLGRPRYATAQVEEFLGPEGRVRNDGIHPFP